MAYVSNEKSNTVSVIDTDQWQVVKTIKVGQRPRGIAVTKDKKIRAGRGGRRRYDPDDRHQDPRDRRQAALRARSRAVRRGGKLIYVAHENDNTVTIVDIEKRTQLGAVQVGVEPEGIEVSPDGKVLINTSETTSMAHFIDLASRKVVASVLVDSRPRFAAFKPDGSELWVSSEIGGTVSVIDPVKLASV